MPAGQYASSGSSAPPSLSFPWPGHLRTRTSRPRRRARLFVQAEKEALQLLLPTIEEGPKGNEDQKTDEIHGLASASSINAVPSIFISDQEPILTDLPGLEVFPISIQNLIIENRQLSSNLAMLE